MSDRQDSLDHSECIACPQCGEPCGECECEWYSNDDDGSGDVE